MVKSGVSYLSRTVLLLLGIACGGSAPLLGQASGPAPLSLSAAVAVISEP